MKPIEHFFTDALAKRFAMERRAASRALTAQGLLTWCRNYLPAHFSKPPSAMHRWAADQLDGLKAERGRKINLIGPRGAAKSTIATLGYVLRVAVEKQEPYIWIISDTKQQSRAHLENIKTELLENALLRDDYPEATGKGPRWRAGAITLCNGVVIEAFGTGQRIRGRRYRAHRPTLLVCDDLQNDGHIASAALRESSRQWFFGTLLKAGTPQTNIVNLATALHRDALALLLDKTPGWRSAVFRSIERWPVASDLWKQWERIYCDPENREHVADARKFYAQNRNAMNEGAMVLWPEVESLYTLMCMKAESGVTAFSREKQSEPIDPERCEWPEDYFEESIWFEHWPRRMVVRAMALDPSKGRDARQGDYSAFVLLGIDSRGVVYVEADLARRPTPLMVADGLALAKRWKPDAFVVEANQFQELLCDEFQRAFEKANVPVRPTAIHNHVAKNVRIRRLGPLLAKRKLRFKRGSPGTKLLVDQLRDFPIASHDDGPDAAEMALRLSEALQHSRRRTSDNLGDNLFGGR